MTSSKVLVTGFGPFEGVPLNPSGLIAKALHNGQDIVGVELPVSYQRSREALREAFNTCTRPSLLLGLGVHGEAGFRFEQQAGKAFIDYPDVDGESGLLFCQTSEPLETRLEIPDIAGALIHHSDAGAWLSQDAGGYLCEWVYRLLLERAETMGCHALFVHVPPLSLTGLTEQVEAIRAVIKSALNQQVSMRS